MGKKLRHNLILIGGRAAGKSKTARHVHRYLGFQPFSTDNLVSYEQNGMSIPQIVKKKGWKQFRKMEEQVLQKVCQMSGVVIDTGGGILVKLGDDNEEAMSKKKSKLISKSGYVIYLKADPKWTWEKVATDEKRPALSSSKSYLAIMKRRDAWYKETADHVIDTTWQKGREIAYGLLLHLQDIGFHIDKDYSILEMSQPS